MKLKTLLMLLLVLLLIPSEIFAMSAKTTTIALPSGKKAVHYVSFQSTEKVELKPVLAQRKVGVTESLASMAKKQNAIAAINGTFFNAYDKNDLQPMGGIMMNGGASSGVHYQGKYMTSPGRDISNALVVVKKK